MSYLCIAGNEENAAGAGFDGAANGGAECDGGAGYYRDHCPPHARGISELLITAREGGALVK